MMILGYFFLFLHKNICGYSLESLEYPQHMFSIEIWRKLSQNYHQIFLRNNSSSKNDNLLQ